MNRILLQVHHYRIMMNLVIKQDPVTYSIDEANNKMIVHSKSTIPLMPSMPIIENYLRAELNVFFRAHHIIEVEMQRQRENMTGN